MLTDEDIKKLSKVFATRDELLKIFGTREEFSDLKSEVVELRTAVHSLVDSVDKMSKSMEDLKLEYNAVMSKLSRHEKWIQQIAEKTGVKLED